MMTTLKKIWAFLKTHWYIPLILIAMVVTAVLFFGKKNKNLVDMFDAAKLKYEKELDIIEYNQKLKEEEQKKNKERYDRVILEIEKKIKLKRDEINKTHKKKVKELLEKHGDDYDSMVKEMADEFGFEVI